jgi:hypothetical protein
MGGGGKVRAMEDDEEVTEIEKGRMHHHLRHRSRTQRRERKMVGS